MGLYATVALVTVPLSLYMYFASSMSYPDAWATRYTTQCGAAPADYNFYTLSQTGMGFIAFGAYFGLLFRSNYNITNATLGALAPVAIFEDPANTDWSINTLMNTLLRLVFSSVAIAACYFPLTAFSAVFTGWSPVYIYIFGSVVPFLSIGFAMFGITDIIMQGWSKVSKAGKLGADKEGTMMELTDYKVVILQ